MERFKLRKGKDHQTPKVGVWRLIDLSQNRRRKAKGRNAPNESQRSVFGCGERVLRYLGVKREEYYFTQTKSDYSRKGVRKGEKGKGLSYRISSGKSQKIEVRRSEDFYRKEKRDCGNVGSINLRRIKAPQRETPNGARVWSSLETRVQRQRDEEERI